MNDALRAKLNTLPTDPGVYFHRDADGQIIYVGKAANLRNRVRQYFQASRLRDAKTDALVAEIVDTDWTTVETEIDALFLESELIKRYKPRYNIMLRDDKSQIYVRLDMHQAYPALGFTRRPLDDGADYYGPYYNGYAVRKALRYLRRVFPYSTHTVMPKRVCLQYHLGLCPGVEEQLVSSSEYKATLRKLIRYLRGERPALMRELESDMRQAATDRRYEDAADLRNRIRELRELQRQVVFGDHEFLDISKDHALIELQQLLGLDQPPRRIEGYDISHMSGTNNVASMVVATNGLADKAQYRKFQLHVPGNDDFAHMREVMSRRFSPKNADWPKPNLLLIDGGKGQLASVLDTIRPMDVTIPAIGLAKQLEEIVVRLDQIAGSNVEVDYAAIEAMKGNYERSEGFVMIRLPHDSHIVKLLQRIRDESHRFAVSYHSTLKRRAATTSLLDGIPGIGPVTRRRLVASFGSGRGVREATLEQLSAVLNPKQASTVYNHFHDK